ncbi:MAG: hypothetical protein IPO29_12150 [Anaerolineae bacterium]|nr:hypothetical protein [Anaerolineae bacterium]
MSGASCESCPANGSAWRVRVEASAAKQVRFVVTATQPVTLGVFPVSATVTLAQWGLPGDAPKFAQAVLRVNHAVDQASFVADRSPLSFRPGVVRLGVATGGLGQACYQLVQVNTGSGWRALAGNAVTNTLAADETQTWQVRVVGLDGLVSPVETIDVRADGAMPTAGLNAGLVVTYGLAALTGNAADDGNVDYVEVRVGDGPFARVDVDDPAPVALARPSASAAWALALDVGERDGETLSITVRAVDGAGNVGASSIVTLLVDTVAPRITPTLSAGPPAGVTITASDGSGVQAVEVSLDGGETYLPATDMGGVWTFAFSAWSGPRIGLVTVRAEDVYGNVSQATLAAPSFTAHLPFVQR